MISFTLYLHLAHIALQNANKDYLIFSYFCYFIAKSNHKSKNEKWDERKINMHFNLWSRWTKYYEVKETQRACATCQFLNDIQSGRVKTKLIKHFNDYWVKSANCDNPYSNLDQILKGWERKINILLSDQFTFYFQIRGHSITIWTRWGSVFVHR